MLIEKKREKATDRQTETERSPLFLNKNIRSESDDSLIEPSLTWYTFA